MRRTGRRCPAGALATALALAVVAAAAAWAGGATEQAKLTATDAALNDLGGFSVALSGDTAIVGARNAVNAGGQGLGAAYVFTRTNGAWTEQARLPSQGGNAGASVAIWGDTAIVGSWSGYARVFTRTSGAWTEQATLSGPADSVALFEDTAVVASCRGTALVFTRNNGVWTQQATLTPSTPTDASPPLNLVNFVSVHRETVVLGSAYEDNAGGVDAGSAYVFTRTGGAWVQQAMLMPQDAAAGDNFGSSIALSGDTVIVGAYQDSQPGGAYAGSAYIFTRTNGTWTQQVKLTASDSAASDNFGESVALSGDTALVGATQNYSNSNKNGGFGAAYVYSRSSSVWTEVAKLVASDGAEMDLFGHAVALSGDTAIVGAYGHANASGLETGAAYVFNGLPASSASLPPGSIETVAGGGSGNADGIFAVSARLDGPTKIAFDSAGNLFIADSSNSQVRRVDRATQVIATVAGTGARGFSGDGGLATLAALQDAAGVAVDAVGNVFIADQTNNRIRRVSALTGVITTIVGDGAFAFSGDGGPAVTASLRNPAGISLDNAGNLLIADQHNNRVRRVDHATGIITTVAGNGAAAYSGDGGLAVAAGLNEPLGVTTDTAGNLYIADASNNRVRRVDAVTGIITTIAGTGSQGFYGDGGLAVSAALYYPRAVAIDAGGNYFVADSFNNRVRRIDAATGVITTVAGSGTPSFSGDGGPAVSAGIRSDWGVALDSSGNLFIADSGNGRIRRVDAVTGIITTVAGNTGSAGDGGPATAAALNYPYGVAVDITGNMFIADTHNQRIRKVAPGGQITTVAGNGSYGFSGDGGPATSATFRDPSGVAVDGAGNLFVADQANCRIRKVTPGGTITTVAGNGTVGFSGDGGPATSASLRGPASVAVDRAGNLFIADTYNERIRKVAPDGTITTVAGSGATDFSGDGGPATSAGFRDPCGVAVDGAGNLFVADTSNHCIRKVTPDGTITTVAGGFAPQGGPSSFGSPTGVAVDGAGNLFITGTLNDQVHKVAPDGAMTTVAGIGAAGFSGDGGPAISASLHDPSGIAVDSAGNVFIADASNNRIRRVSMAGASASPASGLPWVAARFIPLGHLPGLSVQSRSTAVSADGSVVVGWSNSGTRMEPFRWTTADGMAPLVPPGTLTAGFIDAVGVSADGTVVTGNLPVAGGLRPYVWHLGETQISTLPMAPGWTNVRATAISASGAVVVGAGQYAYGSVDYSYWLPAWRWSAATGLEMLPWDMAAGSTGGSEATAISADGDVVIGSSGPSVVRWSASSGKTVVSAPALPGETRSRATAVSADGSVIVGDIQTSAPDPKTGGSISRSYPYRWTAGTGRVLLSNGAGANVEGGANGASADGSVVVGGAPEPMVWTAGTGALRIVDVLHALGADASGWQLGSAFAVSGDGLSIAGEGTNPSGTSEAWLVQLSPAIGSVLGSLPDWTEAAGYWRTLSIAGGIDPVSWTITGLPPGLIASALARTLSISGTPTVGGTYIVTVTARDDTGATVSRSIPLVVNAPLTAITGSIRGGTQGRAYVTSVLTATGGTSPMSWTCTGFPPGLVASPSGRSLTIRGTPASAGTYSVVVSATDVAGSSTTRTLSVVIDPGKPPEEITREYAVSIPLELKSYRRVGGWNLSVSSGGSVDPNNTVTIVEEYDNASAGTVTISGTIALGRGAAQYDFVNETIRRDESGLRIKLTAADRTAPLLGIRLEGALEDKKFTGQFKRVQRKLRTVFSIPIGGYTEFLDVSSAVSTFVIDTSPGDFFVAEGSVSVLRSADSNIGLLGVGSIRVPIGDTGADGLPTRVPVSVRVDADNNLVIDGEIDTGYLVHTFRAATAFWDTPTSGGVPSVIFGQSGWTARATTVHRTLGYPDVTFASRVGRGAQLVFSSKEKPDVALIFVSGHPAKFLNGILTFSPDHPVSYLQKTAGPYLAGEIEASGRSVEATYFAENAGVDSASNAGGFNELCEKLRDIRAWQVGTHPTHVIVVAHSHGGVWAHAALLHDVKDVSVLGLVDLDTNSVEFVLTHSSRDLIRLGGVPVQTEPVSGIGGQLFDVEDVIPPAPTVKYNLEVFATGLPREFDDTVNVPFSTVNPPYLRSSDSHMAIGLLEGVHSPTGQAMPVVRGWILSWLGSEDTAVPPVWAVPSSPRWITDSSDVVVRSLSDLTTPWDGKYEDGLAVPDGMYYVVTGGADSVGDSTTSQVPAPVDHIDPTVSISSPADTYATSRPTIVARGSAADNVGVQSVAWENNRGGQGIAIGTASWQASVPLQDGVNVLTFTATDLGGRTAVATVTVEFRRALVRLVPGFNLISLPSSPGAACSASSLLSALNSSAGCASAVVDASSFGPKTRLATGSGPDFPVVTGRSYFVLSAAVSDVALSGEVLPSTPTRITLQSGLNYVGLPVTANGSRKASEVATDIVAQGGGVSAIYRWQNGAAVPYLLGGVVNDFDIVVGEGFIVLCDRESVWEVRP